MSDACEICGSDGEQRHVPPGWKLAAGWHVRHPDDYSECTWGLTRWQSGCQLRHAFQGDNGMACPIHAERMGALVRDEAPCPECGHVPPHSFACSRSEASRAMRAGQPVSAADELPGAERALKNGGGS